MTLPSYRLEYKETANIFVKATKNCCIIKDQNKGKCFDRA